jgi:hypothetical protein
MPDLIAFYDEMIVSLRADDHAVTRTYFDPDFVVREDPGMPYGGVYPGADGFIKLRHKVVTYWTLEILSRCASPEGDRLVIVLRLTGLPDGPLAGIETMVTVVWSFRGDKALEAQVLYYDTPRIVAALAAAEGNVPA